MIPKQLKKLKFCRVKRGSKAPFEKDWNNKPYSYEKITPLFPMENYGVLCGHKGLAVIDCDNPQLVTMVKNMLPETFSVKTGGGGTHFYYFIPELKKKIILNLDKKHLGEVQSHGTQVVGAGSIHPNGKEYEVIDNVGIKELSLDDLKKVVGGYMEKEKPRVSKEIEDYEKLIEEIVKSWREGDRQELALSISGYLRKEKRLGINKVKGIIVKVCDITEDDEVDMRLRAVDETFKKDEKEVKGFTGLGKIDLKKGNELNPEEFKKTLSSAYENILDILKEYLDIKEEYYSIIALWIIGTYFHNKFPSYPYLFFNAMKGSGKSRILNLVTTLAKDGNMLNSLTEAVLFRTKGCLAIDEFEGISRKGNENLRELLNSAYKKGIKVRRMKQQKTETGTEQVVEEFEVYRPILLANIWGMDNVLGDRCIQLILEKSSKQGITNLIEIFKEEKIVKATIKMLNRCSLCRCSFSGGVYREWNIFIKNKYSLYTINTNLTNNTNNTNYIIPFKIIDSMDLNGRELELSLPLCMIANEISEDLLKITTLTLKAILNERKSDDITDNIDVSLYDFVTQDIMYDYKWESVNDVTRRFKEFMDSNEDWINSKWMGRALKRLGLIKEKRRVGRGVSVMINIEKAKEKIKMFK